ncbi:MAG: DUF2283 domain-containing protein [Candidatus Nanohaloarchaea archaeon]
MEVSYDETADVLYITLRECENTENVHRDNGVVVSKDRETGEVVGYTVMYFSEKEGIDLPLSEDIEDAVPA